MNSASPPSTSEELASWWMAGWSAWDQPPNWKPLMATAPRHWTFKKLVVEDTLMVDLMALMYMSWYFTYMKYIYTHDYTSHLLKNKGVHTYIYNIFTYYIILYHRWGHSIFGDVWISLKPIFADFPVAAAKATNSKAPSTPPPIWRPHTWRWAPSWRNSRAATVGHGGFKKGSVSCPDEWWVLVICWLNSVKQYSKW